MAAALVLCCAAAPSPAPAPQEPRAIEQPPARAGFARVERVRMIGAYLEAQLLGQSGRSTLLFVASDACRTILQEGTEVRVVPERPLARVSGKGAESCAARGITDLAAWRDALPPRRSELLVLTETAELRLLQTTETGELLAAGKLPLALELRWPTPLDVVALLPDTRACRAHLARATTQMEFRARGEHPLVLRGRLEPCPILGLAEPLHLD
jgi:hypothetical protein